MSKNASSSYWAVIKKVEHYQSVVRIFFCYMSEESGWPVCTRIEASVYDSAAELYQEALKLKKGDMVLADPLDGHEIVECRHCSFFDRLKNIIKF